MKIFLFLILLSQAFYSRLLLKQQRTHRNILGVKHTHIGKFSNNIYKGKWKSSKKLQNNYIQSQEGMLFMIIDQSFEAKNQFLVMFEFYEGDYKDNRFMISFQYFHQENFDVKSLNINEKKSKLKKFYNFDSLIDQKQCEMKTTLNIKNILGNSKTFLYNSTNDVYLEGKVFSEDCDIEFNFQASPLTIDGFSLWLFLLINIFAIAFHLQPFLLIIKTQNFQQINQINESVFLMSIIFDFTMIAMNTTYSMRVVISYFEYMALLTFYLVFTMIFKLRVYLIQFYMQMDRENLNYTDRQNRKFYFIIKFLILSIFCMFMSFFLLNEYYYFIILFTFPIIQVIYNACYQMKKNCFHWNFHIQFFIPQIIYPLTIRGLTFNFMEIKQDLNFAYLLISIAFFQVFLMWMQKHLGSSFFLPKILRPQYYNYERKLDNQKDLIDDCAICMEQLSIIDDENKEQIDVYLETPCKHLFHKQCLSKWMDEKFLCPLCRTQIPPYDNQL